MMPFSYSRAGADVLSGLSQAAAAQNDMAAQKKADEMALQRQQFAQSYALQGLQNQMAQRQQGNQLALDRMRIGFNGANSLLQGLFN